MTEERENTEELIFAGYYSIDFDDIEGAVAKLCDRFNAQVVKGKFKVTIEFYPDSEVEDA